MEKEVSELFSKLKKLNVKGRIDYDDSNVLWYLSDLVLVRIYPQSAPDEGYIGVSYVHNGKELSGTGTHWHPLKEEIWSDILSLHNGDYVFVAKTSLLSKNVIMMTTKEFEAKKHKFKNRKYCTYSIIRL
ncbi:hypothetical protein [Breznakia pachnodae]|uniref:Uncharacterized protein n=1 Tax=Breznakia pachnodae TaxID=265178 RepID=A0ABU0E818_9FIRM|nr:hypothetical protein [Breznakia pachnodae]MDQ0363042.1 hypothetical protein [Breznakia pachnodae]